MQGTAVGSDKQNTRKHTHTSEKFLYDELVSGIGGQWDSYPMNHLKARIHFHVG